MLGCWMVDSVRLGQVKLLNVRHEEKSERKQMEEKKKEKKKKKNKIYGCNKTNFSAVSNN